MYIERSCSHYAMMDLICRHVYNRKFTYMRFGFLHILICCYAAFAQTVSDTVSFVNFENREVGVYGNAEAKEDFKRNTTDKSWWYAMDKNNGENSKIVYDGVAHGNVLQLKYPKGCVGPNDNDTPACAAQIIQPLVKTADTMWSAYDIFFEEGFEFQLGGKLPGLCGGKCYTGNAMPETGDGWSARIMWRKGGNAVQLIYFMGQRSEYGDDFKWDLGGKNPQAQFTVGKWHRIVNKVSMNSVSAPGKGDKNGRVQAWLDGELVLDVDTLRLRDYDTLHVDKFYLSTFHGGSSTEWAPTHDNFIRFDNFTVSTDSIAVSLDNAGGVGLNKRLWRENRRAVSKSVKLYRVNGSRVGRGLHTESKTLPLKNGRLVKVVQ